MTYSEKLKDPRWQKKRLQVLESAGWACQSCFDKEETLHVHHLRYHGEPWDAPNNELECLCATCHNFREGLKSAGLETGTLPTRFWRLMVVFAGSKLYGGVDSGDISELAARALCMFQRVHLGQLIGADAFEAEIAIFRPENRSDRSNFDKIVSERLFVEKAKAVASSIV